MTAPTPTTIFPDIPYTSPSSSVSPIITSDLSPQPRNNQSPPTTGPTSPIGATSPGRGLTNSRLTVIIVVPIVLLAILSPILIIWFLSWWRRRRHPSYNRRSVPKYVKLEKGKEKEKEKEKEKNILDPPPPARQLRSSLPKRHPASLPPPPRRPLTTTPDQRESTQQRRTSRIPNHSFSGFNFDFSRRATMFSARSTQSTIRDPSIRPSSTYTWILPPPSASRPMTLAQPYIPPRMQTPKLPESALTRQQLDHTSNISQETLSQSTTEMLLHPDSYGTVHENASSCHSLSVENLSIHNGPNLQAPFSQPHPDAVSDISGLSFDHPLWVPTQQPQRDPDAVSEVSVLEPDPNLSINPHQVV